MSHVPTDRRSIVRVLLRGVPAPSESAVQRRVGDYVVLLLREAKLEDWPGTAQTGDVEGILWTTDRQRHTVAASLRQTPNVVDSRTD
ncbi:MAG: hypothetical protein ABI175_03410 [Polyangiales bacterium]